MGVLDEGSSSMELSIYIYDVNTESMQENGIWSLR